MRGIRTVLVAGLAASLAIAGAQETKISQVLAEKASLEFSSAPISQALETLLKGKIAYRIESNLAGDVACAFKDWPIEDIVRGLASQLNATFDVSSDGIVIRTKHSKKTPVPNTVFVVTNQARQKDIKSRIDSATKMADEKAASINLSPNKSSLVLTDKNGPYVGRVQFIDIRDNTKTVREYYFECKPLKLDEFGPAAAEKDQAKLNIPWVRSNRYETTAIVDVISMQTGIRLRQVINRNSMPADGQAKPLQG